MLALPAVTAVVLLVGCPADQQPEFATASDHQKAEMLRFCRGAGPPPEPEPPPMPALEKPPPGDGLQRITASDGRRFVGNVVSLTDGWYSIRLENGQMIILEQSEVVAIGPLGGPEPIETLEPPKKAPRLRAGPAEDADQPEEPRTPARSAGIAAGILFGIGYLPLTSLTLFIDVLSGFKWFAPETRITYVPIVGAFWLGSQQPSSGLAILAYAAGATQVAGLVMMIVGVVLHARDTPSEPATWYVAPGAGSSLAGVSIGVNFSR